MNGIPQLHKHPNLPNLPFSRQIADPAILSALEKITATLAHIEFFLVEIAANTKPK